MQISFRISESENEMLSAVAALDRVTTNEIAFRWLVACLGIASKDDLVQSQLALHRQREESSKRIEAVA